MLWNVKVIELPRMVPSPQAMQTRVTIITNVWQTKRDGIHADSVSSFLQHATTNLQISKQCGIQSICFVLAHFGVEVSQAGQEVT